MNVQRFINKLFGMDEMKSELLNYIPEHFFVQELVDKKTHQIRGDKAIQLVNNWHNGGSRQWSGLRTKESPYYSSYSQHSFGRAIDFITPNFDVHQIREDIKKFPNEVAFQYITAIEDFEGMTWVHIDVRNWDKKNKGLLVFSK